MNNMNGFKNYPPYRIFWNWELTHDCNYKCSYCPTWCDDVKTPEYLPVSRWKDIWDRMFELYYSGVVRYTGGEPAVYPHFAEIVGAVAKKHSVDITTNLSFDLRDFVKHVDPANVALSASFHPEFDEIGEFLNRVLLLSKNGFTSTICFVGYPPYLRDLNYYKRIVEDKGVMFKFLPFTGEYKGMQYPESYIDEEKKLMKETADASSDEKAKDINKAWYEWNVEKRDKEQGIKTGKLCRMGQMYAVIRTDGSVSRCCAVNSEIMGNIFDTDFRLLEEPAPCKVEHCPCFKAMIAGEEDTWAALWDGLPHRKYK